jgi:hypothetical protein
VVAHAGGPRLEPRYLSGTLGHFERGCSSRFRQTSRTQPCCLSFQVVEGLGHLQKRPAARDSLALLPQLQLRPRLRSDSCLNSTRARFVQYSQCIAAPPFGRNIVQPEHVWRWAVM